jgi:hypothetical protein
VFSLTCALHVFSWTLHLFSLRKSSLLSHVVMPLSSFILILMIMICMCVCVCVCVSVYVPMRSRNVCVEWEGVSPTHLSATHRMPVDPDSLVSLAAAKV